MKEIGRQYSADQPGNGQSGQILIPEGAFPIADLVLDNCGCLGDASLEIPNVPEKVAPTSTAVGAAMLNAMMAQAVALITQAGAIAPVFVSANLDHGDAHNKAMLEKYKDNIFYMGHHRKNS